MIAYEVIYSFGYRTVCHTKCENFAIMIVAIQLIGSDGFLTTHGGDTGYCTRVPGTVL